MPGTRHLGSRYEPGLVVDKSSFEIEGWCAVVVPRAAPVVGDAEVALFLAFDVQIKRVRTNTAGASAACPTPRCGGRKLTKDHLNISTPASERVAIVSRFKIE